MKKEKIIDNLSPHLFWDVNITMIDPEKSKRLIIERVFTIGSLKEINSVTNHYGASIVLSTLKELNYLDSKTLNFVSKMFKVPVNKFKCYTRKQSIAQHWSY